MPNHIVARRRDEERESSHFQEVIESGTDLYASMPSKLDTT
jgi:hypothetical protein